MRSVPGSPVVLAALLALCGPAPLHAAEYELEEAPAPESVEDIRGPILESFLRPARKEPLFPHLKRALESLPPFFSDTRLGVRYRTYALSEDRVSGFESAAWAMGGWIDYQSGELWDAFSAQVKYHFSAPIIAPEDKDGTMLLKTGQEGYHVLGVANAALRWKELVLRGWRQEIQTPYVNRRDSRMTPNTFEAVTLADTVGALNYGAGYTWKIKPRDSDDFVWMSEQAGAEKKRGMASAGVRWSPSEEAYLGAFDHFGLDTFNTLYLEGGYTLSLQGGWGLKAELQFTDQRSVGEELLGSFDLQSVGIRISGSLASAVLRLGFTATADGGGPVQNPWGSSPSHVGLMQRNFTRANEKAGLLSLSWNFSRLGLSELSAIVNVVGAWNAKDGLGERLPDSREVDVTLDYRIEEGLFRGFWLRLRGSYLNEDGNAENGTDFRAILNYDIPLL